MDSQTMAIVVQGGAVGLCVALIGLVTWLIKRNPSGQELLEVLSATNEIIKANTVAIRLVRGSIVDHEEAAGERLARHSATIQELRDASLELRDKIISRPCIAKGE
jgi:hypothetical protein